MPDETLRAEVLRAVRAELGDWLDSIDPEVVNEAIGDAIIGRPPRY